MSVSSIVMAKKKKRQNPEVDDLLARPWCYYCERDFDDLKILIHHQKAKHFKCERCARRLNTAGGLRVHMEQVHKETLEQVENALPGRESIDLEIFGTEGIPESEVAAHNQRILAEFTQKEADRRAASGNNNGPKKPKIDISKELDPEEIKRKLEAHKKAMTSGGASSMSSAELNSPGRSQSPAGFDPQASSQIPPVSATNQTAFSQIPFGVSSPFAPSTFPQQPVVPFNTASFQSGAYPPGQFGRVGVTQPHYNGYQQPTTAYQPQKFNNIPHSQFNLANPPHVLPSRQHGSTLPQPHQVPGLPPKPNIPGLPPRPNFISSGFGRPNQQVPPGAWNATQPPGFNQSVPPPVHGFPPQPPYQQLNPQTLPFTGSHQSVQLPHLSPAAGIVQMPNSENMSSAAYAPATVEIITTVQTPNVEENAAALRKINQPTKQKRETKLIYSDNEMSPEEKRALLSRYTIARGCSALESTA